MFKKILFNKWLISAILVALIILFISLKSVWSGCVFFAMSFLIIFCIYWETLLILYYIEDYYKNFDEEFKLYKAEIINTYNLTSEEFQNNIEIYLKKFKKSLRRDKFIDIIKILCLLSFCVIVIVTLFKV